MTTNKNKKIGVNIIVCPNLFGPSAMLGSYFQKTKFIENISIIDIYANSCIKTYEEFHFQRISFLKFISLSDYEKKRYLNQLGYSFNMQDLYGKIDQYLETSDKKRKVILIGMGYGSNVVLNYLEKTQNSRVISAFLWYPHIILPNVLKSTKLSDDPIFAPNPHNILKMTKIVIFHGTKDSIVEPENLEKAKYWSSNLSNIELVVYPGANHGFAEKFVQNIPNLPFYWFNKANRRAHKLSWQRTMEEIEKIAKAEN